MEPGLLWIVIAVCILPAVYSTINRSEKLNFNNETEVLKRGLIQRIGIGSLIEQDQSSNNEVIKPNPTSIEVRADSILYADIGQQVVVHFEVINNQYKHILYRFEAKAEDNINAVYVMPRSSQAPPYSKTEVRVEILPRFNSRETTNGLLTFKAKWISIFEEEVTQEVYYYTGMQKPDSSAPTIDYTFNGDCGGHLQPNQCHSKIWKADILIQDSDSGLLYIKSNPVGLMLNKKFIIGTKEQVKGYYKANCCQTKVDITALDVSGNEYSITIDIEKKWLSTGEIIAIVLGAIILVLLIIALIACIIYFCRRKRQTLSIYPETIRS